jgi:hypothetical protein
MDDRSILVGAALTGRPAGLSASDKIKAELEVLESAHLECTDSGIRKVIEDWIAAAKQRLASQQESK